MKSKFALAECLSQVDEELLPKEATEHLYGKEERLVSKGNPTGTVFADPVRSKYSNALRDHGLL
jgi:hypothetical protein